MNSKLFSNHETAHLSNCTRCKMYRITILLRQRLTVLLLLLPLLAVARRDTIRTAQGVDVYVKQNQSHKLKLIVEAHAVDIEAGLADYMRLGTGVNADYLFPRFLSVHGTFKGTYYSMLQQSASANSATDNDLNGFMVGSGGVRLHVLDGKGWSWRKITLQSFQERNDNGTTRTTVRFLRAKYPCRRIVALRGGGYYSTAPISANMTAGILEPEAKGSVKTADGTVFTGDYYTNARTAGFYAGITKIINMKMRTSNNIEVYESESKLTAFFRETYLDVIFANTTIDPFSVGGKQYPITPGASGSFNVADIGWRCGGRLIATRKLINMGANYEIGSRPGIYRRGAHVSVGLTIALMK